MLKKGILIIIKIGFKICANFNKIAFNNGFMYLFYNFKNCFKNKILLVFFLKK